MAARPTALLPLIVLAAAIAGPAPAAAQSNRVAGIPQLLFGGDSLEGWGKVDGSPAPNWEVFEGSLYRAGPGGDLYYEGTFGDFMLHFQWKISSGGNSGVKYRVRQYGRQWLGCEYQLLDDAGKPYTRHATGALYDIYAPSADKPEVPAGQWNESTIIVCGDRIEHWLNGRRIVQVDVGSDSWQEHVAASKFRDKEGFGENRAGRIFLQDHGNPVWFRQIVLVPLQAPSTVTCSTEFGAQAPVCCPRTTLFRRPRCGSRRFRRR